ncbi:hypothetical protein D3C85_1724710 [compost metagenome]
MASAIRSLSDLPLSLLLTSRMLCVEPSSATGRKAAGEYGRFLRSSGLEVKA